MAGRRSRGALAIILSDEIDEATHCVQPIRRRGPAGFYVVFIRGIRAKRAEDGSD
jgi:hypothetical protein